MKRSVLVICLALSAVVHADVQTWRFENVALYADPDRYSGMPGGPAGLLTGFFSYDTTSKAITDFVVNVEGTRLTPGPRGIAYFVSPTTIIFDTGYTPETSNTLKLILKQPFAAANERIPISNDSVVYFDYGYRVIHLLGGALAVSGNVPGIAKPIASNAMQPGI